MTKGICDSEFDWCPADAKAGDFHKLRVDDLSPTQFAVGKAEVDVRAGRMRDVPAGPLCNTKECVLRVVGLEVEGQAVIPPASEP